MLQRSLRSGSTWKLGECVASKLTRPNSVALVTTLSRSYSSTTTQNDISYRQLLKSDAKERKRNLKNGKVKDSGLAGRAEKWELTVGIEIHAQLDTERKLFSSAPSEENVEPNSNVALCDLAYPGAQPIFQSATLLPALRAAIALNCEIQRKSSFDRKHYFYPDQPAGYQITQFYEPFAKSGHVTLYKSDGIAKEDGDSVTIGIKQIQLEQDTGKSLIQSSTSTLLDFNRVSHPLIEIISMPHIHHPATAAAYVRKIQSILKSVGAVTTGMEAGGLRADVNVSVRERGEIESFEYYGVQGLGQRTEIKNLNSFKAIEDAVIAEQNRHTEILAGGGQVLGETRGWTLGGTETHRLREKEGEVDYRYMPDPDLGPLLISPGLVNKIKSSMPKLPDETVRDLVESGLTEIDAKTLLSFDNGDRLEYLYEVVHGVEQFDNRAQVWRKAGNLILHDLGSILTELELDWNVDLIPSTHMSGILELILDDQITRQSSRELMAEVISNPPDSIRDTAQERGLLRTKIDDERYHTIVADVIETAPPHLLQAVRNDPRSGKLSALMGLCMKEFKAQGIAGGVQPDKIMQSVLDQVQRREK